MDSASFKNLRKYCYLSSLSDTGLEEINKKLRSIHISSGTLIISEDATADAFYLVKEGQVDVYKRTKWGQTANISVIGKNEGFGEMALLTCSPRCCSVIARTDVVLLELMKKDFEEIVRIDAAFLHMIETRVQRYAAFNKMKTLQPFALLEPEKMFALMSKLEERHYLPGENVIAEGEKGNEYFIVKSGNASVFKRGMDDEIKKVATVRAGEGFGEEALVANQFRNANVTAEDSLTVWVLSRTHFQEVLKSTFLKEVSIEEVLSHRGPRHYLDIRMKAEFDEEHIPGAVNIPLDELRTRYSELDKSREYYVYCLVGARSAAATFLLNSQGYHAKSMKGGMMQWSGPVEEGSEGVHTPYKPT